MRPTFGTGRAELIEAYILDFDGDLYGDMLSLQFLERLRGERRFDSAEGLIEQMHRDVARTRRSPPRVAPERDPWHPGTGWPWRAAPSLLPSPRYGSNNQ